MNQKIYDYTKSICNKIKYHNDKEDVLQETIIVLYEKNMIDNVLDKQMKIFIKRVVWNVSHNFYYNYSSDFYRHHQEYKPKEVVSSDDYIDEDTVADKKYKELMSSIKEYIFKKYFIRNLNYNKYRVWYLRHRNYDYNYISSKLGLTKLSCIQLNYIVLKEFKKKFGIDDVK